MPIVVIPLDTFGETISTALGEEIGLTEPQLLQSRWVKILPVWTEQSKIKILQEISNSLVLNKSEVGTHYESVMISANTAFLIILGSLSLSEDQIITKLDSAYKALSTENLLNSVRLMPIIDISQMVGEELSSLKTNLKNLHKSLKDLSVRDYVYLIQSRSKSGIKAESRDQIMEAIRIYCESIILSSHWDDYANSWLANRISGDPQYASFSVLEVASPQAELIKYLSHVGFHQVCKVALEPSELYFDIPQLGKSSIDTINEQGPLFEMDLHPKIFEAKKSFWDRVQKAVLNYKKAFTQKSIDLHVQLNSASEKLGKDSKNLIDDYNIKINSAVTNCLKEERFLSSLELFSEKIMSFSKNITFSDQTAKFRIPSSTDVEKQFQPYFQALYEKVKKTPNSTSVLITAAFVLASQIIVTLKLLNLWNINETMRLLLFWVILVVWIIGGIYLIWRLPAWQVKKYIRDTFEKAAALQSDILIKAYQDVKLNLADHLNQRNLLSAKSKTAILAEKIDKFVLSIKYLSQQEEKNYPYPEINLSKVNPNSSPFKQYVEAREDIKSLAEKYIKDPKELCRNITVKNETLFNLLQNEQFEEAKKIIMQEIRGAFSDIAVDPPENLSERLKELWFLWNGNKNVPLLDVSGKISETSSYCGGNPAWLKIFGDTLRSNQVDITNISAKDRIYFYKSFLDIDIKNINLCDQEEMAGDK